MYRHNSTIRIKEKECSRCGKRGPIFSRGRCQSCAIIEDSLKCQAQEAEREIKEEGLSELIEIADHVFSRYIRLRETNEQGQCECYTCKNKFHWLQMQNGHYIKRGASLFLRLDPRNCHPQCIDCNEYKGGNYGVYTQNLDRDYPGLVDILNEEAHLVHHWTRHELNQFIKEHRLKVAELLKKINR